MKRSAHGKIIHHNAGLGIPDPEMVRQRALELARIDGREQFTPEDWRRAKLELHGHLEPDEQAGAFEVVTPPDEIAGSVGHRVEARPPAEEPENVHAELFSEGMDEAVHEQMLEASEPEEENPEEA